jgi:ubiquinone/menaquinone biosynthesis C-methylase UbiE/predicted Fe-Mo cluster-binding NifX family protein
LGSYYPESKVETRGFTARHYDTLIDIMTLGRYSSLMEKVVESMRIKPSDSILDLGAGTGRNACLMMRYLSEEGEFIGVDISDEMISQFKKKCANFPNAKIIHARVDRPLPFRKGFDKVFTSFVLHGFPQNIREAIIKSVFEVLKFNGSFFILDYNEFPYNETPVYLKVPFNLIECPYAFDFIKRDWKRILANNNFERFEEFLFFKNYVRLLKAKKPGSGEKNRIRVAIPTNDGTNIFQGMLGRANRMFIYEIKNGKQFRLIEKRDNPFADTMQHLKTLDVHELLRDCAMIVSGNIGRKGIERLREKGMKLVFKKGDIQEALTEVIKEEGLQNNTDGP